MVIIVYCKYVIAAQKHHWKISVEKLAFRGCLRDATILVTLFLQDGNLLRSSAKARAA